MKTIFRIALVGSLLTSFAFAQSSGSKKSTKSVKSSSSAAPKAASNLSSVEDLPPLELKTFRDSMSYALGVNVISTIQRQKLDINPNVLMRALDDAFSNKKMLIDEAGMASVFKTFEAQKQAANAKETAAACSDNKEKGKKYMEDNAKKPGVIVTPSGLQYRVLEQGTGTEHPVATDKVKVHYIGTLIDGTKFDSSYDRKEPIEFELNRVIKGWTEGVQLMTVGSRYEFTIPSDLAYGDHGAGNGVIPPGSTLVFEVELLGITPAPVTPPDHIAIPDKK